MENKKYNILVNFEGNDSITSDPITIVKGDYNSVDFEFQFNKSYNLALFFLIKPNGKEFVTAISENKLTIDDVDIFDVVGKYQFGVSIYDENSKLTIASKGKIIVVDDLSIDSEEVKNDSNYKVLDDLVKRVESLLPTYNENATAQLKEFNDLVDIKIKEYNEKTNELLSNVLNGSPLVASSIEEMVDTTRVYVNTTDGHWYYYNGSSWASGGVYQAIEIAKNSITTDKIKDKNVTYEKLSFIKNTIIKNIHNPENILPDGKCWHYANGNETVINGYFGTTKYEVNNNPEIFFTDVKQALFFDAENKFLKTISEANFTYIGSYDDNKHGVYAVKIPDGAEYFALNYQVGTTDIVVSFQTFNNYIEPGVLSLEMEEKDKELINDVLGFDPNIIISINEELNTINEELNTINEELNTIDKTNNLKMNCMGDSITYGYIPNSGQQMEKPYPLLLKELLNLSECRNYGISGSRLVPYNDLYNPVVNRYIEMDDDADIVSVFIGTNDYEGNTGGNWGSALGTIEDTENTTFYGCLNILCNGLITKYPDKFIFFITPIHRKGDNLPNARGVYLYQYANAIKEVCEKFGIPVLDAYSKSGIYPSNETQKTLLVDDGLHPNQICQETKLAPMIASFIKSNFYNY